MRISDRRTILVLVAALALMTLLPACSTGSRVITIGIVNFAPVLEPVIQGFKEGMSSLGWAEGVNIRYLYDGPVGKLEDIEPNIQKYLDLNVDLLLAVSTPVAQRAQKLTAGTQKLVVFVSVLDPIGAALVTDKEIRQRTTNYTGIRHGLNEAKRLEWFVRVVPGLKKIYAPFNPDDRAAVLNLQVVNEAAAKLGVQIESRPVKNTDEIIKAIDEIPADVDGLLLLADNLVASQLNYFVDASLKRRLPLAVPNGPQVDAGALLAFGFDFVAIGKQSARLVDQVLKGVYPGDLPIETAEFFLTLNQWTANQIGLPLADSALRQADHVVYKMPARLVTPTAAPSAVPEATTAPTMPPTTQATEVPSAVPPTPNPTPAPTEAAKPTQARTF